DRGRDHLRQERLTSTQLYISRGTFRRQWCLIHRAAGTERSLEDLMFDKLVESEPKGAVRSRRNYFMTTMLGMSVISLTSIVVSILADDYSMNAGIELTELIAPVEMAVVTPEQPQPRQQLPRTQQSSSLPTREIAMARVEDTTAVPNSISTTPNTHLSIPI